MGDASPSNCSGGDDRICAADRRRPSRTCRSACCASPLFSSSSSSISVSSSSPTSSAFNLLRKSPPAVLPDEYADLLDGGRSSAVDSGIGGSDTTCISVLARPSRPIVKTRELDRLELTGEESRRRLVPPGDDREPLDGLFRIPLPPETLADVHGRFGGRAGMGDCPRSSSSCWSCLFGC